VPSGVEVIASWYDAEGATCATGKDHTCILQRSFNTRKVSEATWTVRRLVLAGCDDAEGDDTVEDRSVTIAAPRR